MPKPVIVAALKTEVEDLLSQMERDAVLYFKPAVLYRGELFSKVVDILVTGVGAQKMTRGLGQACAQSDYSEILHVGFAGGTSPVAGSGALVIADKVMDKVSGEEVLPDVSRVKKAKALCVKEKISAHTGGVVSVREAIARPHEKAAIGASHTALAIDMESFAAARFAKEKKIPFLVLRSVFDAVETELPDFQDCIDEAGETSSAKVVRHILCSPKDILKLPNMKYYASQARETLTRFTESWLRQA